MSSIGETAFGACSSLTSIVVPEGITTIEFQMFHSCGNLASVTLPESLTSIGNNTFVNCSSLTSIVIPDGVTSIGDNAFYNCDRLASIFIPDNVVRIGNSAFEGCTSLAAVFTQENSKLEEIGDYAFYDCNQLASINIPKGVTRIGDYAFYDCTNFISITSKAITPPSISAYTFYNVDKSIPVYVPSTSLSDYQAAEGWKDFTNFVGIDTRIETPELKPGDSEAIVYDLKGRRITNTEKLPTGVYIQNGKKFMVK